MLTYLFAVLIFGLMPKLATDIVVPYMTPRTRGELFDGALEILKSEARTRPGLEFVFPKIAKVMEELFARMPEIVTVHPQKLLEKKTNCAMGRVRRQCGLDNDYVRSVRKSMCLEITLMLHSQYLAELKAISGAGLKAKAVYSFYLFWNKVLKSLTSREWFDREAEALIDDANVEVVPEYKPHYKMSDQEVADFILGLKFKRDPSKFRWGLGSISGAVDFRGNSRGTSFFCYWKGFYKADSETQFRKRMLPLLPANWQRNFKPKNFKFDLQETGLDVHGINDVETLYRLVSEEGDLGAFRKLRLVLVDECQRRFPDLMISIEVIERCIHCFQGGDLVDYVMHYSNLSEKRYGASSLNENRNTSDPDVENSLLIRVDRAKGGYGEKLAILEDLEVDPLDLAQIAGFFRSGMNFDQILESGLSPKIRNIVLGIRKSLEL